MPKYYSATERTPTNIDPADYVILLGYAGSLTNSIWMLHPDIVVKARKQTPATYNVVILSIRERALIYCCLT